jgi:hypothetical protein
MPKLRGGFTDLRATIGGGVFPGLLGFPRTDLAAHFQTGRDRELAGFQINVELAPGHHCVRFEALQVEGVWQQIGALELIADATIPPVGFPVPTAPVRGPEFGQLLHAFLTEPAPPSDPDVLAHRLVAGAPFPRDLLRPTPPFHGTMASPVAIVAAANGFIDVQGDLFHASARIRRVFVSADLHAMQPLAYGSPTPEVAARHPRNANARACGYAARVFVPSQLPDPVALRLYAELADGSLHLVHVARVQQRTAEDLTRPFNPGLAERLDEALGSLRRAIAHHQLALVTDAAYERKIARTRDLVRAPAPRQARAPLIELENTFRRAGADERAAAGLPRAGIVIAGLVSDSHPEVAAGLAQAMSLLKSRHPELAGDAHLVLVGSRSGEASPEETSAAGNWTTEDALRLADLTVRTTDRGAEGLPAGDTVALAEALARRLHRLRRELNETRAAP